MEQPTQKYTEKWYNTFPLLNGFDDNLKYFRRGEEENKRYWQCFNGRPDFEHQTVIDVGCGHGSLCIDIAASTESSRVIGVDTNNELIDFAMWNLHTNYRVLESRVEFYCIDVSQLKVFEVDVFLSKDSFEHILDLDDMLASIKYRLKPGGRLYTGFEPLYHSPFGGHPRIHDTLLFPWLPWGHLMISEKHILKCVNRQREQPVLSIYELGLNKLSVCDFRRIFEESGLRVISFETNLTGKSWRAQVLKAISRSGILEKYMIFSIFAVLEKPA
jgi:ubiquinone/menaquinone biosynthesis C-methylase UbiE